MKRCATLLILREMQIKSTVRYYFIPVRMAIIKKSTNNKCWRGCGKKGPSLTFWWKCKLMKPLCRTVRKFLWKLKNFMKKENCMKVKVAQLCWTLCNPMDYRVHGILQTRILQWVAIPFSRESLQPRDRTRVSSIASGFFTSWATREAHEYWSGQLFPSPGDLPDPGIELGSLALQVYSLPAELSGEPTESCHMIQQSHSWAYIWKRWKL